MSTEINDKTSSGRDANLTDIIGVPYNFGQPKPGVVNGPKRMREAGLVKQLQNMGLLINDTGDLQFEDFVDDSPISNVRRPRALSAANKLIANAVANSLRQHHHHCLVLGGDHSLAIGSIYGQSIVQPDFGVIWVDAHGDINPPLLSKSGNAHGMPLAFIVHELRQEIPADLQEQFSWLKPCLHLKDIAYIGLRDVDEPEKKLMAEHKMMAFTMDDVRSLGIETVVRRCIDHVSPNLSRPIHVSYDVDGVDPEFTPSTGTAVPGGLTLKEGIYIMEQVGRTGKLSVVDIAEVNPEVGSAEDQAKTLDSTNKIVAGWFSSRKALAPGSSHR
jgi:arginase